MSIIDYHGRLRTVPGKNYFVGEKSNEIAYPAGSSLFWSSASDKFYNELTVTNMVRQFGIQIIRCAMTAWSSWSDGYVQNPLKYKNHVETIVSAAIKNKIYVIIDWHCEGNNSIYVSEAKEFFKEMAQKYNGIPNVIYEIWNEPTNQTWDEVIRPYCVEIVKEIRKWDSHNLILCGTQTWSQRIEDAAKNPIIDSNLGYVLHFYSNLHGPGLYRNKINLGVPIFVSEWGTPGEHRNTDGFITWLEENKIPHVSWAINNKDEPLSYFVKSCRNYTGPWEHKDLTETGKIFLKLLNNWRGNSFREYLKLEAENFTKCSPEIKTETTQDTEGVLNVGWISNRSWLKYKITVSGGLYKIQYRVSSLNGGKLRLDYNSGKNIVGELNIPKTGGWQNWITISHTVQLPNGTYELGIFALTGGWNLNWITLEKIN